MADAKALRLQQLENEMAVLEAQKKAAVMDEDYDSAHLLKEKIEKLKEEKKKVIEGKGPLPVSSGAKVTVIPIPTVKNLVPMPKAHHKELPENKEIVEAARSGRKQDLIDKLDSGVDIDSLEFQTGNTALHAAVEHGQREIARLLVERNANLNVRNRRGQTPLHISVEKRIDDMTKLLMEHGADPNIQDNMGKSPLDLASRTPTYHMELMELAAKTASARRDKKDPTVVEQVYVEDVDIYLKNYRKYTLRLTSKDNVGKVVQEMAARMNLQFAVSELQLFEDAMGKERPMANSEIPLEVKSKWSSDNPKYFRFLFRPMKGASGPVQDKFRDVMYSQK